MAKRNTPTESLETIYIALLRAVNVGGRNKIAMSSLNAVLSRLGACSVRTYLQSGNAVYSAESKSPAASAAAIRSALDAELGLEVPVILRDRDELARVARTRPFGTLAPAPETLHVGFLADAPPTSRIAKLDPARSPGDAFSVRGREIYLHFPSGVARSKLTNRYLDTTLATTCTLRNWRTVTALADMAEELAGRG